MAEGLFFKFKVSGQMRNKKCSWDVLLAVAKKMTDWRSVVPYLLPEKGKEVEDEIINDSGYSVRGKRRRLLERWIEIDASHATYEKLVRALISAERTDLAEIVCKKIGEFGPLRL